MHALIVLAHPEEHSFSAAMARTAADALTDAGWTVDLDDLAREGFHAEASRDDFAVVPSGGHVQLMYAQEEATATTGYAPAVADQIQRLQAADLLVTVFPFWWFAPPAQLKGWFDRVFANGVGYGHNPYDDGPLKGTRALAVVAIGGDRELYGPSGRGGDIHALLNPVQHGTFGYAAMDVLEPFLVFEADGRDDAYRASELQRLRARLARIADEAPIVTVPLKAQ
jgi:NAD(P)H dehydrogenase (quinone)